MEGGVPLALDKVRVGSVRDRDRGYRGKEKGRAKGGQEKEVGGGRERVFRAWPRSKIADGTASKVGLFDQFTGIEPGFIIGYVVSCSSPSPALSVPAWISRPLFHLLMASVL